MPIYAYRCEGCGFQKDALQKLSDPPLVDCPQCGQPKMVKQVTAAGFALKGSGWYVTDFRDQKKPAANTADSKTADSNSTGAAGAASGKSAQTSSTDSGAASTSSASTVATTPAPSAPSVAAPATPSASAS